MSTRDRLVLRSTFGLSLLVALGVIGVFLLGDAVLRGAFGVALVSLPWLALAGWVVYLVMVRPCVVLEDESITLVNVLRVHTIPWAAVDTLRSRFQVSIETVDGRVFHSWGAPTTRTDRPLPGDERRAPTSARDRAVPVHLVIERWRATHEGGTGFEPVSSRWDLPAVVGTFIVVAACTGSSLTAVI